MTELFSLALLILACAACTVSGFFYALIKFRAPKTPPPETKSQLLEREKRERQRKNFFNYDGSKQNR